MTMGIPIPAAQKYWLPKWGVAKLPMACLCLALCRKKGREQTE